MSNDSNKEISIDELKSIYEEQINKVIKLLDNKIVVFDFDGTLTELKYADESLLPCKQAEIEDYSAEHSTIYNKFRALKTMKYIMARINKKHIYILTTTVPSLIRGKQVAIMQNFDNIDYDNVIHVFKDDAKIEALAELFKKHHKQIVYIDDNLSTLLKAEEHLEYVTGIHISSLIA